MRKSFVTLFAGLALAACSSGTRIVVIREPAQPRRPAPVETPAVVPTPVRHGLDPIEPLEITIGRPHRGYVYVHTNRPAYVAIFEIIPDQSTSLVRPATVRERRMVVSGLARVSVWWSSTSRSRVTRPAARAAREVRYIYALAADRPIRLEPEAFRAGFFPRALGVGVYRARNPYVTMRALARRFAPDVPDERWAEDVYVYDSWRAAEPVPVARLYCRGTIYEVPADLADRTWCPRPPHFEPDRVAPGADDAVVALPEPAEPDSVKGNNGRRVQRRAHGDPTHRAADRVREPMPGEPERPENPQGGNDRPDQNPGNQGGRGQGRPDNAGPPDGRPPRGGPPMNVPANPPADPPANPPVSVPTQTPVTTPGSGAPGQSGGQAQQGAPTRPDNAGRPETPGRPANAGRPEPAGKPETAGPPAEKPTPAEKPAAGTTPPQGKPEPEAKPASGGNPSAEGKPEQSKPAQAGPPASASKPAQGKPAQSGPPASESKPAQGEPAQAGPPASASKPDAKAEPKGKQSLPGKAEPAPDSAAAGQAGKGKAPPGKGGGTRPPAA